MKRVVVHIDRLVLKGFRPEDRHAIAAGLQEELGRVLAGRETVSRLTEGGNIPRLHVGDVHLARSSNSRSIGERVARGIGTEIRK